MGKSDDAFEILRDNDPIDESTVADADSPKARALLAEIVATPRRHSRRPERSVRQRLALAVAGALVGVVSVAATVLVIREVTDPVSVACYEDTSLDSDVVAVASGDVLDVRLCEDAWREGTLTNDAVALVGQVPPLTGCVTDAGNFAVFPSADEDLCQTLGLADPLPVSIREGDAVRRLNGVLVAHFAANDCQLIEDAENDIRRILDRRGYIDWRIQVSPGGPGRPCASFGLDAANETIRLIPIPIPPSG